MRKSPLREQSGFTIVEVMVAILLLLIGVLGTVKMVDAASALNVNNRHRDAATNIARHIIDVSRNLDYFNDLSTAAIAPALQQQAGLGDADLSSPATWEVVRKGTTFVVTVTACTYDDPKDGTRLPNANGSDPNGTCPGQAAMNPNNGTVKVDPNADDFRRVHVDVAWHRN